MNEKEIQSFIALLENVKVEGNIKIEIEGMTLSYEVTNLQGVLNLVEMFKSIYIGKVKEPRAFSDINE